MLKVQLKIAYKEYLKWYENLGINREYFSEKKITSVSKFAERLIEDDELWLMFGENCTTQLTLIERQEIFKDKYPNMLDIPNHRYYDDFSIPTRKLIK